MTEQEKGTRASIDENGNIVLEIFGNICCSCFKDLVPDEDTGRLVCPDRCP